MIKLINNPFQVTTAIKAVSQNNTKGAANYNSNELNKKSNQTKTNWRP